MKSEITPLKGEFLRGVWKCWNPTDFVIQLLFIICIFLGVARSRGQLSPSISTIEFFNFLTFYVAFRLFRSFKDEAENNTTHLLLLSSLKPYQLVIGRWAGHISDQPFMFAAIFLLAWIAGFEVSTNHEVENSLIEQILFGVGIHFAALYLGVAKISGPSYFKEALVITGGILFIKFYLFGSRSYPSTAIFTSFLQSFLFIILALNQSRAFFSYSYCRWIFGVVFTILFLTYFGLFIFWWSDDFKVGDLDQYAVFGISAAYLFLNRVKLNIKEAVNVLGPAYLGFALLSLNRDYLVSSTFALSLTRDYLALALIREKMKRTNQVAGVVCYLFFTQLFFRPLSLPFSFVAFSFLVVVLLLILSTPINKRSVKVGLGSP
jgi:hypothetical protein